MNLSDLSDNNRFQFETGTLSTMLALVVLTSIVRALWARRRPAAVDAHPAT